jgi:hypothetical protein
MKFRYLILILLFLFVISDALMYISWAGFGDVFFTPVSLAAKYISLFILIYIGSISKLKTGLPSKISIIFKLLLAWNIITIIRGAFLAKDYWDWKFLLFSTTTFLLIPLAFFIGKNLYMSRLIIGNVLKYLFLFGFLLIPLTLVTNPELYSRIMIPVSLFILFIPYLRSKWQILILIVAVTSVIMFIGFRTNLIKIGVAFLILTSYYFRTYIRLSWIKLAHIILFLLPIILLFSGISGKYNLFEDISSRKEYKYKYKSGDEEILNSDTRSFLYVEVINSLIKNNKLIAGEGGSGKYQSDVFDYLGDNRGRYGSEVGFLNTLLYSGIIGVILYAIMLYAASFIAIYRSNNWLCKMLGLYITFRWMIFFIEEFTQFDLNFLFLWITIGLVSSTRFRLMSDNRLKLYFWH